MHLSDLKHKLFSILHIGKSPSTRPIDDTASVASTAVDTQAEQPNNTTNPLSHLPLSTAPVAPAGPMTVTGFAALSHNAFKRKSSDTTRGFKG